MNCAIPGHAEHQHADCPDLAQQIGPCRVSGCSPSWADLSAPACGARLLWPKTDYYQEYVCTQIAGHDGPHNDYDHLYQWEQR